MSKTVDQRVVEMRFDNRQFEENVKTSMSTLDKLKHALKLDGASKGLENVGKASKGLDFSSIAANVESLSNRFSTFGIVGMRVLERMTDSCINFAQKGIGFVTSKIIEGGKRRAFNIENAHFQLQGLLKDEEKVQAVMADAMESVDGTAYAYDEAAKAASQFAASGLQAGEEMLGALRGITGVAAMTNSDYESISRIFTTVAGNGRMMGDQLLQLSSRGLNAASTLAEYFNKVKDGSVKASDEVTSSIKKLSGAAKVTEADIREWTSKGKISFKMFASAMDETFGEHAKKANETFTGAMANMGAALARIGAKFVSPLIEQNGPFVKLFNTLRMRINDVNKQMDPFAQKFTSTVNGMANSLNKYFSTLNMSQGIETTMKKLQRVFNHLVGIAKQIGNILFPFIKRVVDEFKMFGRVLEGDHVSTPLDRLGDTLTHVRVVLGKVSNSIKENHTLMQNWRNTIRGVLAVFDILAQVIGAVFRVFGPTNAEIGNATEGMLSLTGGVGEYLYEVDKWLRKTNAIEESLRNFKKYVTDALNALIDKVPGLREALDVLDQTFTNLSSSDVVDFLNKLEEAFINLGDKIGGSDLQGMELVRYALEQSKIALDEFAESLLGNEHPIVKTLEAMWEKFRETWVKVEDLLKKAKERFNLFIQGLDFEATAKNLFGAGSILYALYELKRLVDSKIKVGNSLAGALNQIKLAVMDWRKGSKWNVLIKIASAIAILAGSLFLISKIESDKLMPALRALSILGVELVGFFEVMQLFEKTDLVGNISGSIGGLYAIVIALGGMAFILTQLAKLSWDDLSKGLGGIVVMTIALGSAAVILGREGKRLTDAVPGVVIAIAALYAMVGAMFLLQFIDFDKVGNGLIGLAGIMVALYLFCREVGKLNLDQIHIDPKTFEALIPLAAAVVILAVAIRMLSGLNIGQIAQGLFAIATSLILFLGSLKYLNDGIDARNTDKLIAAAGAMMMVAVAMDLLLPSILILGAIPWDVMLRGLGATILGIVALSAALEFASRRASAGELLAAGGGMMMIAAAMNMLLPVILVFGYLPFAKIAKGILIFLGALAGFAIVGRLANGAAVGLLALGTSLMMISSSLVITGIGLSLIAGSIIKLTIALGLLAVVGKAALPELVKMLRAFVTELLTALPDILAAVAESIGKFLSVLLEQIVLISPKIAEAFTAILLSLIATLTACVPAFVEGVWVMLSEVMKSLAKYLPEITSAVIDFLIAIIGKVAERMPELVHVIAELIRNLINAVIEEIKNIDTEAVVRNIEAVGFMAKLMLELAGLAVLAGAAMIGVLEMGFVIAELTLVLAAIGKLSEIPGLTTVLGKGGELLQGVGDAIGKFVGGIVGGFMEGMSSQLPGMGEDLSKFMDNLQGFLTGCKNIDARTLESAKTLTDVVTTLTSRNGGLLKAVTNGLGIGSLANFGRDLEQFGPYFAAFADSIKDVQAGTVIATTKAAESLAVLAKTIPNSGGMLAGFVGNNDLVDFAKGLKPFGEAMADYSAAVDGKINEGAVEASTRAGTLISDFAKKLPNSKGLWGMIAGDNDLADFAKALGEFGKEIVKYCETVDGKINEGAVEASVRAATIISDFATKLPRVKGLVSAVTGDNSLSRFATELNAFAPAYVKYAETVEGVPAGVVIASAHCIGALSEVANGLTSSHGLQQLLGNGSKSLFYFGEELEKLGKSYGKYFDEVSRTDSGKISESIEQLKEFIGVAGQISGEASTGLGSLATFITQAASIGKDLMAGLSNGVTEGASSLSKSIESVAKAIIDTTKKVFGVHSPSTVFAEIGRYLMEGLVNGINKGKSTLATAAKSLATSVTTAVKTGLPQSKFSTIASTQVVDGLVNGLRSRLGVLLTEIQTECNNIIQKFITCLPEAKFKTIGANIITYIINGLKSKQAELSEAIKWLCDQIATTFREGINPEAYAEVGTRIVESIVLGIRNAISSADSGLAKAVAAVNSTIVNTFKSGLKAETFVAIGKNVAAGLSKGIKDGQADASKAAASVTNAIVSAVRNAAGVSENDSKEVGEVLADSLSTYSEAVKENSDQLVDDIMRSTEAAYRAVCYILEHEFANGPVIRPVVDLSGATDALYTLQNEFGNGLTARMASNVNLMTNRNTLDEFASRMEKINASANDDVVSELQQLRTDVNALNANMSRLQVVLDSGTLVGAIAPDMDARLGQIAKLKSRGV